MASSEGELFDYLTERFGIGDYDEGSGVPYWKYRGTEISKIKAMLKRRGVTVQEMMLAANFAAERKMTVRAAWDLLSLIPPAKRAASKPSRVSDAERLQEAARDAAARGMLDWASRLVAADPSEADRVLAEWALVK